MVFITGKTAAAHFKSNPEGDKNRKKTSGTCIIVLLICKQYIYNSLWLQSLTAEVLTNLHIPAHRKLAGL